MREKNSFILSGIFAVSLYIVLIFLVIFYFDSHTKNKPKHFVKNKIPSISVSLKSLSTAHHKKSSIIKPKPKRQKHPKKKAIKKKIHKKKIIKKKKIHKKKKVIKKKVIKKKPIKKKKTIKKHRLKKVNKDKNLTKKQSKNSIKNLFDKVKIQNTKSKDNHQKTKQDNGVQNAYFASIEEKLKDWPTQSDYAGEKAIVWIKVEPSGDFVFRIKSASSNIEFNSGLTSYLKQLQRIGLGRHKGGRAYTIDIEFIATD